MTTTQQPEALNLEEFRAKVTRAAREPLLARIAELEAQLSAIGAGGVEPLRKQAEHKAAPADTTAAWVRPVSELLGHTDAERAEFEAVASDNGQWPQAIERDARGNYLLRTTAYGWMWWQAARRAPAAPQAVQAAEPETREALAKRLIADVLVADTIATSARQRVAELSDRDSPADWPESMLVTGDELHMIVREAVIEAQSANAYPAEGVPATDGLLFQCGKAAQAKQESSHE